MRLSDFWYDLPEELIAQRPLEHRDQSRLMCVDKKTGEISHRQFCDIVEYFSKGDCLILNDSRVIPARLFGKRSDTGALVEIFLLRPAAESDVWECLVKPGKKAKKGVVLYISDIRCEVIGVEEDGNRIIKFSCDTDVTSRLKQLGEVPLPPYIHEKLEDSERYQTVYSRFEGSVAAPTAGLHFTKDLLRKIEGKGVNIGYVTLHVGLGTFRPVKEQNPEKHKMHTERYILPESTAKLVNETIRNGKNVFACGTTSVRVLETAAVKGIPLIAGAGDTDIFIYPPYKYKAVGKLITNFHLPESTLIMLVSAFASRDIVMNAYAQAVKEKYRFFSFGDASLWY